MVQRAHKPATSVLDEAEQVLREELRGAGERGLKEEGKS